MFEDCIAKVTLTEDKVDWLKEAFKERHKNTCQSTQNRVLRLQTEYNQANTRLSKLYDLKLDGGIPDEIFKTNNHIDPNLLENIQRVFYGRSN